MGGFTSSMHQIPTLQAQAKDRQFEAAEASFLKALEYEPNDKMIKAQPLSHWGLFLVLWVILPGTCHLWAWKRSLKC